MSKVYSIIQPRAEAVACLKELLMSNGIKWLGEEAVNQGYGMKISGEDQGSAFSGVLYFNKKGLSSKLIIDKGSERLLQLLEQNLVNPASQELVTSNQSISTPAKTQSLSDESAILNQLIAEAHLGTDESGKGDYFGPLVVAGVLMQPQDAAFLKEMGVADSKTLADKKIKELAESLRAFLGGRFNVVFIMPEKYNQLYAKMGNLNKLLAWGHARVMENLLERQEIAGKAGALGMSISSPAPCSLALADKFGDERLIQRAMLEKGRQIRLLQIPRAERDPAVAAASILAREMFVRKMAELSQKYGVVLPKGCNRQVQAAALQIIARHGREELAKVVKLHFKTTQDINSLNFRQGLL